MHHWLQGLVGELDACASGGWPPDALSLSHVWITSDEDAVILPSVFGTPADAEGGGALLQSVSAAVLAADERRLTCNAWPFRSRAILSAVAAPEATLDLVRAIFARPRREGW